MKPKPLQSFVFPSFSFALLFDFQFCVCHLFFRSDVHNLILWISTISTYAVCQLIPFSRLTVFFRSVPPLLFVFRKAFLVRFQFVFFFFSVFFPFILVILFLVVSDVGRWVFNEDNRKLNAISRHIAPLGMRIQWVVIEKSSKHIRNYVLAADILWFSVVFNDVFGSFSCGEWTIWGRTTRANVIGQHEQMQLHRFRS